jgi:hypothetical protein
MCKLRGSYCVVLFFSPSSSFANLLGDVLTLVDGRSRYVQYVLHKKSKTNLLLVFDSSCYMLLVLDRRRASSYSMFSVRRNAHHVLIHHGTRKQQTTWRPRAHAPPWMMGRPFESESLNTRHMLQSQ